MCFFVSLGGAEVFKTADEIVAAASTCKCLAVRLLDHCSLRALVGVVTGAAGACDSHELLQL